MMFLKQSTASQSVLIGPFIDEDDGKTAETGLTIAVTDIRVSKNGGNMIQKDTSGGGTHDEAGWYTITLNATDTNTVGRLQISVHVAGALPVWAEFQVLEENIYEALFASGAAAFDANDDVTVGGFAAGAITSAAYTAGAIDASAIAADAIGATEIANGAIDAATFAAGAIDASAIAADAIGSSELATTAVDEIVDGVWDELATGHTDAGKAGQQLWTDVDAILDDTGTTLDGKLNTAQLDLDTITGAAGAIIDDSAANDTTISDAVWDEAIAGHVGVGSFGEEVQAHAQTGDAMDLVANAVDATSVATGAIDADAIAADAITNAKIANDAIGATEIADGAIDAATFAAGAINAAAIATDAIDADALAANAVDEIWDEAMTETTGAPAVTASFREALKWMFALSRNKITQNATTTTLRNDADAADLATSTVSDDATTYTRGEWSV